MITERQVHIVPARVILSDQLSFRIVKDDALGIRDVDLQIHCVLLEAPDGGARFTCPVVLEGQIETTGLQLPGFDVFRGEFCQQLRSVDQRFFHRLPHAWFDLFHEHVQDEPRGQTHNQKVAEQNA